MASAASKQASHKKPSAQWDPGALGPGETFWRDHYDWLRQAGYILRARYQPNWIPSWKGTKKAFFECEDGIGARHSKTLDAQRVSDGRRVMLKRYDKDVHPYEADIAKLFSSEPLASSSNRCVPVYEVLQLPNNANELILVMPELRHFDSPRFDTIGEIVEFIRQIFEGLQFMHQHHVAHRDISYLNVMMDASNLYIDRYHPFQVNAKFDLSGYARHYTRTQKPVKYYLTDFGLSRKFDPKDGPPLVVPIQGGDRSVPEFKKPLEPCNPFPIDVYCVGNLVREFFIEGNEIDGKVYYLAFLKPLIADMIQDDASKRPTMDEVVTRFDELCKQLSSWTLRSRAPRADDHPLASLYLSFGHWKRRISYVVKRVPPLPTPSS